MPLYFSYSSFSMPDMPCSTVIWHRFPLASYLSMPDMPRSTVTWHRFQSLLLMMYVSYCFFLLDCSLAATLIRMLTGSSSSAFRLLACSSSSAFHLLDCLSFASGAALFFLSNAFSWTNETFTAKSDQIFAVLF